MHRTDGAGHVGHLFVTEDPAINRPPSEITESWLNSVQEELCSFIEWCGFTLDKNDTSQFLQAIIAKFVQKSSLRNRLTADLTLYVSTTGSDANNGLTAVTPFATIQHAYDVLQQDYDLNGFQATIQLADGTYTSGLSAVKPIFGGSLLINGNAVSPGNVIISTTSASCVVNSSGTIVSVQNFKCQTTTAGSCLIAAAFSTINITGPIIFGACAGIHLSAALGIINVQANYTVNGTATVHWSANDGGRLYCNNRVVTLSGTPAFSIYSAQAYDSGLIYSNGSSFVGAATGVRYNVVANGVINTAGSGASYLPGNSAGSASTGGQYV